MYPVTWCYLVTRFSRRIICIQNWLFIVEFSEKNSFELSCTQANLNKHNANSKSRYTAPVTPTFATHRRRADLSPIFVRILTLYAMQHIYIYSPENYTEKVCDVMTAEIVSFIRHYSLNIRRPTAFFTPDHSLLRSVLAHSYFLLHWIFRMYSGLDAVAALYGYYTVGGTMFFSSFNRYNMFQVTA